MVISVIATFTFANQAVLYYFNIKIMAVARYRSIIKVLENYYNTTILKY